LADPVLDVAVLDVSHLTTAPPLPGRAVAFTGAAYRRGVRTTQLLGKMHGKRIAGVVGGFIAVLLTTVSPDSGQVSAQLVR